ncbi:hypothetical protein MAPG_00702 [Magnaporthiopsis poae ATCC 64411]|uniref:Uncharacterized protein n=1 Tax=Magnaporthiopsis poae (strain ATCC 64411 / 73-15) TaxID=644358 RepID=A0A0C4DLQ7_MAGP6|nr:hypothetical protein MAPG_00702 [Magnaporthiopsis poae ATCC 64411]
MPQPPPSRPSNAATYDRSSSSRGQREQHDRGNRGHGESVPRGPVRPAAVPPTGPRKTTTPSTRPVPAQVSSSGKPSTSSPSETHKDGGTSPEQLVKLVCDLTASVSRQSAALLRRDEHSRFYKQREESYRRLKSKQPDYPSISKQHEQYRNKAKSELDAAAKEYDAHKHNTIQFADKLARVIYKALPETIAVRGPDPDYETKLAAVEKKANAEFDRKLGAFKQEFDSNLEACRQEFDLKLEARGQELEAVTTELKAYKSCAASKEELNSFLAQQKSQQEELATLKSAWVEAKQELESTWETQRRKLESTWEKERDELTSALKRDRVGLETLHDEVDKLRDQVAHLLKTQEETARMLDMDVFEKWWEFVDDQLPVIKKDLDRINKTVSRLAEDTAGAATHACDGAKAAEQLEPKLNELEARLTASNSTAALQQKLQPHFDKLISVCGSLVENVKRSVDQMGDRLAAANNRLAVLENASVNASAGKAELAQKLEQNHSSLRSEFDQKYSQLMVMVTQLDSQYQNINTKPMVEQIAQYYHNAWPINEQIHTEIQQVAKRQKEVEEHVKSMFEEPRHKRPRLTPNTAAQPVPNGHGS